MISCEQIVTDYKAKYITLANALPMGMMLLNMAGEVLEINQAANEFIVLLGGDDAKSMNMLSDQTPKDVGISDLILKCADTKATQSTVLKCVIKGDKGIQMKATVSPVLDDNSDICDILLICEDLTEVDALKNKYWKISRTMAAIIDGIESHFIFAKDEHGVYQCVNKAFADMFGKNPMEIVGKTDKDLFPSNLCAKYHEDDVDVMTTCGMLEIEEEVLDPRYGELRHWRTFKTAVCDAEGKGVVLVGIGEDIEDRFQMRESAFKAIMELEAFVKRTRDKGEKNNVDVTN